MNKCEYKIMGPEEDGLHIKVKYKNPFVTPSKAKNPDYADIERLVPVQFNENKFDKDRTDETIESLALGVYAKMLIAHNRNQPKKKAISQVIETYSIEESDNDNASEKESNDD